MAKRSRKQTSKPPPGYEGPPPEGGPGASDATSGGGAGSGIPDADMLMREGGKVAKGDIQKDKEKLFPESVRKPDKKGKGS